MLGHYRENHSPAFFSRRSNLQNLMGIFAFFSLFSKIYAKLSCARDSATAVALPMDWTDVQVGQTFYRASMTSMTFETDSSAFRSRNDMTHILIKCGGQLLTEALNLTSEAFNLSAPITDGMQLNCHESARAYLIARTNNSTEQAEFENCLQNPPSETMSPAEVWMLLAIFGAAFLGCIAFAFYRCCYKSTNAERDEFELQTVEIDSSSVSPLLIEHESTVVANLHA